MPGPRSYSRGTLAALFRLSRGTCYWPDPPCKVPATIKIDGDHVLNLTIAHIRAANRNGPRWVAEMSDHDRSRFSNLILLCQPHHVYVDGHPATFTIAVLDEWKRHREGDDQDELKSLGEIDDEGLQHALGQALAQHTAELQEQLARLEAAIARLSEYDADAAALLRDHLAASEELAEAAFSLRNLEDSASQLASAAYSLRNLEDNVSRLGQAADSLRNLEDSSSLLHDAAEALSHSEDTASRLSAAVIEMHDLVDRFVWAVDRMGRGLDI